MNAEALIEMLERFGHALPGMVAHMDNEDARWKPADGAWSIVEVVCHLADEEVADFRARLRLTLAAEGEAWPAIDPEGWARERAYNQRDLATELARFTRERVESLQWLQGLGDVDWSVVYEHPKFGPISAGDLLAAWAAHDWLHCRQIAKRLYQKTGVDADGFSTAYAGEWKA